MYRVLVPGGLAAIIKTDWGEPLISPPDEAVRQFFELFEKGFNHHGGSLNRGRHLRSMMRRAGFNVTEFSASCSNANTPEAVQRSVASYMAWMANLPLFDEAIEVGWVDRPTLNDIEAKMRRWSEHPDAFLALGHCKALGRKDGDQ